MSNTEVALPFDPTGESPDNRFTAEVHELSAETGPAFALNYGSYYTESLIIRAMPSNELLKPNIDYKPIHLNDQVTRETGKEVCAVIRIMNPNYAGTYHVTYQAVGGNYSINIDVLRQLIEASGLDDRPVSWGEILNVPEGFPPAAHVHDIRKDVFGWDGVITMLERIEAAIKKDDPGLINALYAFFERRITEELSQTTALDAHKQASDAHTKSQVGLGNVPNYGPATDTDVRNLAADKLMTPQRMPVAVQRIFTSPPVTGNVDNTTQPFIVAQFNPHSSAGGVLGDNIPNLTTLWAVWTGCMGPTNEAVTAQTPRWQIAISQAGIVMVRHYIASYSQWMRIDTRALSNVANYSVATESNVGWNTTTSNRYLTPAIGRTLVENILTRRNQRLPTTRKVVRINDAGAGYVDVTGLTAGTFYMVTIQGRTGPGGTVGNARLGVSAITGNNVNTLNGVGYIDWVPASANIDWPDGQAPLSITLSGVAPANGVIRCWLDGGSGRISYVSAVPVVGALA